MQDVVILVVSVEGWLILVVDVYLGKVLNFDSLCLLIVRNIGLILWTLVFNSITHGCVRAPPLARRHTHVIFG